MCEPEYKQTAGNNDKHLSCFSELWSLSLPVLYILSCEYKNTSSLKQNNNESMVRDDN